MRPTLPHRSGDGRLAYNRPGCERWRRAPHRRTASVRLRPRSLRSERPSDRARDRNNLLSESTIANAALEPQPRPNTLRLRVAALAAITSVAALAAIGGALGLASPARAAPIDGIHNIQHVVMIMQENRSFDSYFGTYPGANGIPAGTCVPDPLHGGCVPPFHDSSEVNNGAVHSASAAATDIDGGKMDGFVARAEAGCSAAKQSCIPCKSSVGHACVDVMGYHDAREIPNYWTYAQNFVLQDNMYENVASWSLPEHLSLVSAWSAVCPGGDTNPMDCASSLSPTRPTHAANTWTDITYLLHQAGVSWRYYIFEGAEPDCESDEATTCAEVHQGPTTAGIWNPLADFTDVKQDGQREDIQSLDKFYGAVHNRTSCGLANVSWIAPNFQVSEHPTGVGQRASQISVGQAYVTTLINSIMRSPCWGSTAIFLSWDDWGGFYDHAAPPAIDQNGYGMRVPGLVISPYANAGGLDHQQLSHDAYLKFIEDDFLGGGRLNPASDGRPDSRPDVREEAPGLGSIANDFNFNQTPRAPLLLPAHPEPGPASGEPTAGAAIPQRRARRRSGSASSTRPQPAPRLQLVASVAHQQDMRLHRAQVRLVVGCNRSCSLLARGTLLIDGRRPATALPNVRVELSGGHAVELSLSLSPRAMSAVRAARNAGRSVGAAVELNAAAPGEAPQSYLAHVELTYR
jgi:phospholipase C